LAAGIAAVVTERGLGGDDVDLRHRLDNFRRDRSKRADDARAMVRRWAETAGGKAAASEHSPGSLLALAYPDRIAKNRGAGGGSFLLANGRGGNVDPASPLAREPYLAVAELTGAAAASRIVLAAAINLGEIEAQFAGQIEEDEAITFEAASASLRSRRIRKLRALMLSERTLPVAPGAAAAKLLAEGAAGLGMAKLPWSKAQLQFRDRVNFLRRAEGDEWPDLSDRALARTATDWLAPFLDGKTALSQVVADDLAAALDVLVPWNLRQRLNAEAPTHFMAPSGSNVPIDYEGEEGPKLAIRVQELFGLAVHPVIARGHVPLLIELLSPAHRPVQVTRDLPGFWRGSYKDVRSDLRGRYPKHPWPDDPLTAPATRRAKPRGG
jgi:ATP-dependent helicase HrpB